MRRLARHIYDTKENKIASAILIGISIPTTIIAQDATFLVLMLAIAIPVFFAKKRVVF